MPLYMDIHNVRGATAKELDKKHAGDLKVQGKYHVEYLKYWFNERSGKAFCLVNAASPEAAELVHREAHGQIAERIIEVEPELAEAFLGGGETGPSGLFPWEMPSQRYVWSGDIVVATQRPPG